MRTPWTYLLAGVALLAVPALAAAAVPTVDRVVIERVVAGQSDRQLDELYRHRAFAPLWLGEAAKQRRSALTALLARESALDPALAVRTTLIPPVSSAAEPAQTDLVLTRALLDYLQRRSPAGLQPATATVERVLLQLEKASIASPLSLALLELRMVDAGGGWARVTSATPAPAPLLSERDPLIDAELLTYVSTGPESGPAFDAMTSLEPLKPVVDAAALRRRLAQSRDLAWSRVAGDTVDAVVTEALHRFQQRHGLLEDGVVGPRTLAALNEPVAAQIRKVELNLARAAATPSRAGYKRYVEVNVPGYELRLVAGGEVTLRARAIVGDEDSATPIFDDVIRSIEFNPSWYVPISIQRELVDKFAADPGYFVKNGFVWRGGEAPPEGGPPSRRRLVQKPGPENALGQMKFLFPNHHAVYIHDTPQRGMFGRSSRSLSHGCVRVEHPKDLALALLALQGWDMARIDKVLETARTQRIELTQPLPVFLDYRTAFTDDQGRLQLRADIYGHDAVGMVSFPGKGNPSLAPRPPKPAPVAPLVPAPVEPPPLTTSSPELMASTQPVEPGPPAVPVPAAEALPLPVPPPDPAASLPPAVPVMSPLTGSAG